MKKIIINGTEYILYGAGEDTSVSKYPHMTEAVSGEIPMGRQLSLLKVFLVDNGITPIANANTHWCIEKAMKISNSQERKQPAIIQKTAPTRGNQKRKGHDDVPPPSSEQVDFYLDKWDKLENYHLQENALDKLFSQLAPDNKDISNVLLKASTLNDFYSTNIFSIFSVAKHIVSLDIDARLKAGDVTLVGDIQRTNIGGTEKNFYSFSTKYCSHHNPLEYPIYDSYVDRVLRFFRDRDGFAQFTNDDLKKYDRFKKSLIEFRKYYRLEKFDLKQIDKYLWQLGKDYFPKRYGKKNKAE